MPNWCWNSMRIEHDDVESIDRIEETLKENKLFLFSFDKSELGRDWRCDDWYREDTNTIRMTFDTAWSPPLEFYEYLRDELGYRIDADYEETGMGFIGSWTDEDGDDYWEYIQIFEEHGDDWRDHIPERYHQSLENEYEYFKESSEENGW